MSTRPRGISLIELVFVAALALLVAGAILFSIVGFGWSQQKDSLLSQARMTMHNKLNTLTAVPLDELESEVGVEEVEANGYTYEVHTAVANYEPPFDNAKRVTVRLKWKFKASKGEMVQEIARVPK